MWRIPAPNLLRMQLSWHVHQDSRWFVTIHASSLRLWSLPQIKQARRARCRSRPSWGPTTQIWPRATCRFPTGARSGVTDSIIFYFTLSRSYFETHVRLFFLGDTWPAIIERYQTHGSLDHGNRMQWAHRWQEISMGTTLHPTAPQLQRCCCSVPLPARGRCWGSQGGHIILDHRFLLDECESLAATLW